MIAAPITSTRRPARAPIGKRDWWVVLEIPRNSKVEAVRTAWRKLSNLRHPDKGGSEALMVELNQARVDALLERQS